ncbi:MAG: family 14 glycosylhydrolase [Reinekea sp.]|jgi:beta-amylase
MLTKNKKQWMTRQVWHWLSVLLLLIPAQNVSADKLVRPAVMSPLAVSDWTRYQGNLNHAENIGVVAVSTDVWWGMVEKNGDQQFDWSYYDQLSDTIIKAGLKWVPILSFHQCGGNVGDDCNIPIPDWVWENIAPGQSLSLKYKSELGNYNSEVISLWSDAQAKAQYVEFIQAFAEHFASKAQYMDEINISAGTAGELRYPAYNSHDHWRYPGRGYLQAYNDNAIADFQTYVQQKYQTLAQVNAAWNSSLENWTQITPPMDYGGTQAFFDRQDYLNSNYGKDFVLWYNEALLRHGDFMLSLAHETLTGNYRNIPLGVKVPGIHWLIGSPETPRAAEVTTGLISTDVNLNSDADVHGYARLFDRLKQIGERFDGRPLVVHFTCLEMNNDNVAPQYSLPKDLVFWIGKGAHDRGIPLMGENALSGGIGNDNGWNNIGNAFQYSSYQGLTVLRVNNLNDNDQLGFERYQQLIQNFTPETIQ